MSAGTSNVESDLLDFVSSVYLMFLNDFMDISCQHLVQRSDISYRVFMCEGKQHLDSL